MATQVIGVRFREASRMYHFARPDHEIFVGEYVVVETPRGLEMGHVVTVPDPPAEGEAPGEVPPDVKPIVRMATGDDRDQALHNQEQALILLRRARELATAYNLDLFLAAFQINLGANEATGYFHAEAHVNFRDLTHSLEDEFGLRVEMHHAGPRDRAKLVDGYDLCGQRLCCSSWMTDFPKVGIRMAKEQDLSLNPDKISGVCGRLLCCLTFEFDVYKEMRGTLPKIGKRVSTPAGMGKVIALNTLAQKVTIFLEDHHQRVEVPAEEIGLAVRVEEAPNEALVEERESRGTARRSRGSGRAAPEVASPAAETPSADAPATDSGAPEAAPARDTDSQPQRGAEGEVRRRRRRRRGRGGAEGRSDGGRGAGRAEPRDEGRTEGRRDAPDAASDSRPRERPAGRRSESGGTDGASEGGAADAGERRPRRRRRRRRRGGGGEGSGGSGSSGGGSDAGGGGES